jgi:2-dehydropantoate 2-reductase
MPKVLVFGAGAVGSTIGGMLAQAGHNVTLVGRNPHMMRIGASGLRISGLWGEHHVTTLKTATTLPAETPDWILLTTKAYDTEEAGRVLARAFPRDVPILHLQNGIGNAERLATVLGWPRVLSGMIIIGFQITMAGQTRVTVSADKIKIGRKDGAMDPILQNMAAAFNAAHMPAEAVPDIQKHLWGKVLYNASLNALGGILGVKYGDLLDPHPWTLIERIIQEAFQALNAEGQALAWRTPPDYLGHLRNSQIPATFEHKPSMQADLQHGRRTEIDFINGALIDLGRRHGVPMPVNETLVAMVHALEENGRKGVLHPTLQQTEE